MIPFRRASLLPYVDAILLNEKMLLINKALRKNSLLLEDDIETKKNRLYSSKVVYIHAETYDGWADLLIELQEEKPLPIRLVIIGSTDYTMDNEHIEALVAFMPFTQFWIQNWMGSLPNCLTLPIGSLYNYTGSIEKKYTFAISYMSFNGSSFRKEFFEYLDSKEASELTKYHLQECTEDKFYEKLAHLRFSPCPMGCGFDTHRFWECLMTACIPIVKDHPFYDTLFKQYPGLPVIRVKEWSELLELFHTLSDELYVKMMKDANVEVVWEEYWLPKIESACREERSL